MPETLIDSHPENIDRFERFSELAGLQVADMGDRLQALRELDANKFLDVMSVANGLLRGEDSFQRWSGEPEGAIVSSLALGVDIEPPARAQEMFSSFFDNFTAELEPNEQDMQKAGVEMYFAIIGTHMFSDGNGRLARSAYYLIKDGRLPEDQSTTLERSKGVAKAANLVNQNAVKMLLDKDEIDYKYINEFAADDKQADDGVFAYGGWTQQLKYIAARRVMLEHNEWPEQPSTTLNIIGWSEADKNQFAEEYEKVREEWLGAYIDTAGNYAPGLAKMIEGTAE